MTPDEPTKSTKPESTEPESTEPESTEPESTEPESAVLGQRPVSCAGCGRRVPVGGCKPVDGEPYCPDCFIRVAEGAAAPRIESHVRASVEPTAPVPAAAEPSAEPSEACAACAAAGPGAELAAVEGFRLCRACREADPALAVKVARARHRRRLARLERDLAGDTDS